MDYPHYTVRSFEKMANLFPFNAYRGECANVSRHDHDYLEITYVFSGTGMAAIGEETRGFKAHDLQVTVPGTPHFFASGKGATHNQISVGVTSDIIDRLRPIALIDKILDKINKQRSFWYSIPDHLVSDTEHGLETIYQEFQLRSASFEKVILIELAKLFIIIERLLTNSTVSFRHFRSDDPLVWDALRFMETNYYRALRLRDILQDKKINEKYFSRLFKKEVGYAPIEYLNRLRIEKCCSHLSTAPLGITHVALNCGFNDMRHFNRIFKRYLGISPRDFKKRYAGQRVDKKGIDRFSFPARPC
jgi:AraC-like DNA-binding protein